MRRVLWITILIQVASEVSAIFEKSSVVTSVMRNILSEGELTPDKVQNLQGEPSFIPQFTYQQESIGVTVSPFHILSHHQTGRESVRRARSTLIDSVLRVGFLLVFLVIQLKYQQESKYFVLSIFLEFASTMLGEYERVLVEKVLTHTIKKISQKTGVPREELQILPLGEL